MNTSDNTTGVNYKSQGWLMLFGIGLFLVLFTGVISALDLDRKISGAFYLPDSGFFLAHEQPWEWLYLHGTTPGFLLILGAVAYLLGALFSSQPAKYKKLMLITILTGAIATGILVNAVLKPYWGRPRPVEIVEFGGEWQYRHAYSPGTPGKGQSFPSGHAAMGFVFIPLLFFRKTSRLVFVGGIAGLCYGGMVSAARVVQGAHFVSDVIWSFGITLLTATALYYLVFKIPEKIAEPPPRTARGIKVAWIIACVVFVLLACESFFSRRPFFETYVKPLEINDNIEHLRIHINQPWDRANIKFLPEQKSRVLIDSKGFGTPFIRRVIAQDTQYDGNTQHVYFDINMTGRYIEMNHRVCVILPISLENRVVVSFARK